MSGRRRWGLTMLIAALAGLVLAGLLARKQVREVAGFFAERVVLSKLPGVDDTTRSRLPDILLISVDTWRKSELGFYDPSVPTTPHLDRRRDQFIRFGQAISQAPWTGPAHLALFYSRQPPVEFWEWDVLSLTQILGHYGYTTAAFTDGGWLGRGGGIDAGFDHFETPKEGGARQMPLSDKLAQVQSWLEEDPAEPFFLFVHTYHTHATYDPEPEYMRPLYKGSYKGRFTGDIDQLLEVNQFKLSGKVPEATDDDAEYVRALYRAEIREVDEFLEQLFTDLEARGLWDDMLVIVTSDHGESYASGELLNVPLLIKTPADFVAPSRLVTAQVELLDLPPTILALIGIEPPEDLEGQSFLSLLTGHHDAAYDKRYARSSVAETSNYGDAKQSVRTEEWKYILHPASGREELYHLTTDPEERHDVAESHPHVVAGLREFLQDPDRIQSLESPTVPNLGPEDQEILRALGYIE